MVAVAEVGDEVVGLPLMSLQSPQDPPDPPPQPLGDLCPRQTLAV